MKLLFGQTQRKSILRKGTRNRNRSPQKLRFRDLCKTSNPFLSVFSRDGRFMRVWQVLFISGLVYESWAFPFRLAFCSPNFDSTIFYIDLAVDVIVIANCLVESCADLDFAVKGSDNPASEVKTAKKIIWKYSTYYLPIHIFCLLLYSIGTARLGINVHFEENIVDLNVSKNHWIWWALTLPRIAVRGYRLYGSYSKAMSDLNADIHYQGAKKIATLTILSAHWIGCLHFFMSRLRGLDRRTWVSSVEDTLVVYNRFDSSTVAQYLIALFKGFSSISGIEFTAYLVNNPEEQIAALFMIIVQVYISSLILGTIIHFFALKDPHAQHSEELLKDLHEFVQFNQIPPDLEAKLTQGLEFQIRKKALDNVNADFSLSRSLEIKVARVKYSSILQKCGAKGQLFYGCSEQFLDEMVVLCNTMFFMSAQDILEKGDISRELIFLVDGAVEVILDNGVAENLSSDVREHSPCVGEIAFFLGIMQPWTVRAHKKSDVRVAILTREDSEFLFKKFPDQREKVCQNLLRVFDLDSDGSFISTDEEGDRDVHRTKVRAELNAAIVRRKEESFASLVFAAKNGDLDVVKMLLQGGMELHRDYDGRTALAYAARAGVYKVCEFLLEERADANALNRWGQTPLDEAIAANQGTVIQLLARKRAKTGGGEMRYALIDAAGKGDTESVMRILRDKSVPPDIRDYDQRSALHLACANGQLKVAELLVASKADINCTDRWGGTPLECAVNAGFSSLSYFLWSNGATMDTDTGIRKLCEAAAKGNLVALRNLRTCRVVSLDSQDYDGRTALIISATEGRVLAVSYLLTCSCCPNIMDRWSNTALDVALKGKTLYHMYCAKLIQSWGGKLSTLKETEEGRQALQQLETVDIDDVRKKLRFLIEIKHDQMAPKAMFQHEIGFAFDCCMAHVPMINRMRDRFEESRSLCVEAASTVRGLSQVLKAVVRPICEHLDAHPFLHRRRKFNASRSASQSKLVSELQSMDERDDSEASAAHDMWGRKKHILIRQLSKTIGSALEDGVIDVDEDEAIQRAWDNLAKVDQEMHFQVSDELDSDEEAELRSEVDLMMEEREYCDDHGLDRTLYQVSKFQSTALRIGEMEEMYDMLCSLFARISDWNNQGHRAGNKDLREPNVTLTDLTIFFAELDKHTKQETPLYEIEEIFEEAQQWAREWQCTQKKRASLAGVAQDLEEFPSANKDQQKRRSSGGGLDSPSVPLRTVVAGSVLFRDALMTAALDEIWCLLKCKSRIGDIVPEIVLRSLIENGTVVSAYKGEVVFKFQATDLALKSAGSPGLSPEAETDEATTEGVWFVVVSGSLTVISRGAAESEENSCGFLVQGQFFGGYARLGGLTPAACTIKARAACTLVRLQLRHLDYLQDNFPLVAARLAVQMGECPKPLHPSTSHLLTSLDRSGHSKGLESPSHSMVFERDGNALARSNSLEQLKQTLSRETTSFHSAGTAARDLFPLNQAGERSDSQSAGSEFECWGGMSDFYVIQSGLRYIEESWRFLSGGSSLIGRQVLQTLKEEVGEIGSGTFLKLFMPSRGGAPDAEELHDLEPSEFWGLWIALLADKRLEGSALRQRDESAKHENLLGIGEGGADCQGQDDEDSDEGAGSGWGEWFHSRFSTSRRLARRFFDARLVETEQYERAYVGVTGDLKNPLILSEVPSFLRQLFPDYKHRISSINCSEFRAIFGNEKSDQKKITWPDIKKVLRTNASTDAPKVFVGNALHPDSKVMLWIERLSRLLAAYHFASVPWRICFRESSDGMLDEVSVLIFVPADVLTFVFVLVKFNTAFKCPHRNVWVVDRRKIAKRVSNLLVVPVIPIDWILYALGCSYETCVWFRLLKLLFCKQLANAPMHTISKPIILILQSVAVMHVIACVWFYCGINYKSWNTSQPYSWFKIGYPKDDPRYQADSPMDGQGREYHGLSCNETETAVCRPGDQWYYFGMWYDDPVLSRYLLSLWIACSRVANQGLIGNIVPQNYLEVGFCIAYMVVNLTGFRYVIGELSAWVLGFNEEMVEAQARAVKVTDFASRNKLPAELAAEIKDFCNMSGSSSASVAKSTRVLRYLPHSLQVEVARQVCGNLLDKVCLFQGCSDHFKDFLIVSMSTCNFSHDEYIFRLGEVATEMFVVQSGAVDESVEAPDTLTGERVIATIQSGQALGALALFFELRHMYSARASRNSGVTCLRLGRERFLQLLKYCPEEEERITENAMASFRRKFGNDFEAFQAGGKAESMVSTREASTFEESAPGSQDTGSSSFDLHGAGRKARNSISHLKSKRRMLRTHVLLSAARSNNLPRMQWALTGEDVSVNDRDDLGRSALHVAASEGHREMVEALLAASADVGHKDHLGNNPLNEAVLRRHDEVAAAIRAAVPGARATFPDGAAGIRLCEAAASGDAAELARLITNKVSVRERDYDKRTALHLAASEGRVDAVQYLLSVRADVDAKDLAGNTPLDDAVRHGHAAVQAALHGAGARVGGISNVVRACRASADGGHEATNMVRTLVEMGLDPMAADLDGRTPIHMTACSGKLELLEFLVGFGEKRGLAREFVNVVDGCGFTPLDDARRHGHTLSELLLQRAGGLRSDDPGEAEALAPLRLALRQKRRLAQAEAVRGSLSQSPETGLWQRTDERSLPLLHEFLRKFTEDHRELSGVLESSLQSLRRLFDRYTADSPSVRRSSPPRRSGAVAGRSSEAQAWLSPPNAAGASFALRAAFPDSNMRREIDRALERIQDFFLVDCELAKEAMGLDFTRCRLMQANSVALYGSLHALRLQIRRSGQLLRFARKVLKGISTTRLSILRKQAKKDSLHSSMTDLVGAGDAAQPALEGLLISPARGPDPSGPSSGLGALSTNSKAETETEDAPARGPPMLELRTSYSARDSRPSVSLSEDGAGP